MLDEKRTSERVSVDGDIELTTHTRLSPFGEDYACAAPIFPRGSAPLQNGLASSDAG
jgi:hypothetical protein